MATGEVASRSSDPERPGSEASTSVRAWSVLLVNRTHQSTVVLSSYGLGLFLPFVQADLDLSYLEIGILQGVWWGTPAVLLVPFSLLFARFNPNRRVLVALALMAPCLFSQGLAIGFWTLLASRFLTVLVHASMAPARPLLLRWWAAPRQYSTVSSLGLSMHSTFMAAALTFGPIIIVVLDSWRLAYFVQGALMAAHLLVWTALTWGAKEPAQGPEDAGAPSPPPEVPPQGEAGTPDTNARPPLVRSLVAYPHAWLLGVVMLWLSASWTTILTFLPTILEQQRGIAITSGSVLFGFLYYVLIPGALAGSWIFNHITNRRLLVLLPAALNLVATVVAVLAGNVVIAALALTGLGIAWVFVPAMEILPFEFRNIRTREVSVLSGLVQTFGAVGFGAGPVIAGALAQVSGSLVTGVLAVGALTALAVVAAAALPGRFGGRLV